MVIIDNVNKYFNKKKKNEVHVINNTSLKFDKTGLVGILGPSGCGKTTLLNAIGGLDNVNNGKIYVNGEKITKRRSGKIDEIRTLNIGYIFQNYNLIDNLTVFDNVAMVLKMIGVKSKSEIKSKVNYALEVVGMYRYRNRYADMLSGGERQRVGIARAIVKNPAIIIADEPTGNLDSRNTLEVMNIIKSISRNKLVILVTHEEKLASFYASRIIRIKDGLVDSDLPNEKADNLDYRVDNKIYLKDMKESEEFSDEKNKVKIYSDGGAADIKVVIKNGNIYIQNVNEMGRVEIIDDNSSIELVEGHYKEMTQEEMLKYRFDMKKLVHRKKAKYSSIIGPWEMIKSGFKKVIEYKAIKKILLVGFFVAAMFIMYALSNICGTLNIQDSKFVTTNKDYLTIVDKNVSVEDYLAYQDCEGIDYLLPGNSKVDFKVPFDGFYQTSSGSDYIEGSLTSLDRIKNEDLIKGRMPQNKQEIVVDKLAIDNMIDRGVSKMAGYDTVSSMLGKDVEISGMSKFTIVGITDKESPNVYTSPDLFFDILAGSVNKDNYEDGMAADEGIDDSSSIEGALLDYKNYDFDGGKKPAKDYEVVVNANNSSEMPLNKTISKKVNGHKLKVVGYYKDEGNSNFMLVNTNTLKYSIIEKESNITVCPNEKHTVIDELESMGLNVEDNYTKARTNYVKKNMSSIKSALILAGIIMLISFVEIFLIMRASFLSRIKEVGTYRAIGVKKKDIYKMFLGEIIAITTISGLPGFAFMSYIVSKLTGITYLKDMFIINPGVMLLGIMIIFGLNIIFGLLPVFRTLRKTPAAILSRTDVD